MAWSWSHTVEAYENAKMCVELLPRKELEVIFAEWKVDQYIKSITLVVDESLVQNMGVVALGFEPRVKIFKEWRKKASDIPADALADQIWEWMEELRTCDNGGFNAWACPFGCHTVPFSPGENLSEDQYQYWMERKHARRHREDEAWMKRQLNRAV